MSEDQEGQEEPREDSDRLESVRAWGKRNEERAKQLADDLAREREINRRTAIRQAGADPDDWFGQTVMATVERDNISDPDDIAGLVRLARAAATGGQ